MTKKKTEEFLRIARERLGTSISAERDNREDALMQDRFIDGEQWSEKIKRSREEDGRPCLTFNKLRKFVNQIAGDIRQNKPTISVRPVDNNADVEGALSRQDIIRHIEYISNADVAYKTAVESALRGGYGYIRVVNEEDPEGFEQDIKIKRVANRFSVYLDQSAEEITYEDGRFAFVSEVVGKEEFKRLYPKVNVAQLENGAGDIYSKWFEKDTVRIAEYFYKEPVKKEIAQLQDGTVVDVEKLTEEQQAQVTKTKTAEIDTVYWCKIAGNTILEEPVDMKIKKIPIIPVLGIEENREGKRKFRGLVYDAIDAQRMYNYWLTHSTEAVALAPKAPFLGTREQFEGHEVMWGNANTKNYPFLVYNDIPGTAKPSREEPPAIQSAAITQAQNANADIQDTIGRYEASSGQTGNEKSGRAIIARQKASDATTFTFVDNFMEAVAYTGKIILEMIPIIYDTERILKIRGKDGQDYNLPINSQITDAGQPVMSLNKLTVGKYDLVIEAGAGYQTKRQEIAASMLDFLQFVPMAAPIIAPKLAEVMDWEGAGEIAQELQTLIGGQMQQAQAQQQQQPPTQTEGGLSPEDAKRVEIEQALNALQQQQSSGQT